MWWYLGGFLTPGDGGEPGVYWIAILLRMACELYLVAVVVRDIWRPDLDPVARDIPESYADRFGWRLLA